MYMFMQMLQLDILYLDYILLVADYSCITQHKNTFHL